MKKFLSLILFLLFSLTLCTSASAYDGVFSETVALYIIVIGGLFCFLAYLTVSFVLYRHQNSFGPWLFFGSISLIIAITEFGVTNETLHKNLIALAMLMFFFAALVKHWDISEMVYQE